MREAKIPACWQASPPVLGVQVVNKNKHFWKGNVGTLKKNTETGETRRALMMMTLKTDGAPYDGGIL